MRDKLRDWRFIFLLLLFIDILLLGYILDEKYNQEEPESMQTFYNQGFQDAKYGIAESYCLDKTQLINELEKYCSIKQIGG